MRHLRPLLLILACIGLLVSQLSGLHMHIDAEGYTGAPQHTHVHIVGVPPHDPAYENAADVEQQHEHEHDHPGSTGHEGEHDVSIAKLSSSASKVLIFFAGLCLCLLLFSKRLGRIAFPAVLPMKMRRVRWRPPLRAPPLPIGL